MQLIRFAFVAATASAVAAQAVTEILKPSVANPTGCRQSMPSGFNLYKSEVHSATKQKRQDDEITAAEAASALKVYLNNTVLTDSNGRTGAIVANYQFQFDGPPQAGTLYTAGYCLLPNNSLVLGNSAVWWSCNSGGFDNLYDRWWAAQCRPVLLNAFNTGEAAVTTSASASASASPTPTSASASHSVLQSFGLVNSSITSVTSASHSGTATLKTTTTGSVSKASTIPAPSATSSGAAAATHYRIAPAALALGALGAALL